MVLGVPAGPPLPRLKVIDETESQPSRSDHRAAGSFEAMTASILAPGFYVEEGHCWRMVRTGVGHPSHCPEPAGWTGRYVNPKGQQWTVWACHEHVAGLEKIEDVRSSSLGKQSR